MSQLKLPCRHPSPPAHRESLRRPVRGIARRARKCASARSSPPKSCASTTTSWSSTPASSPRASFPIEEFKNDQRRARSQARRFRLRRDRGARRRLRRHASCRATRPSAWPPGSTLEKALESGDVRHRHHHRQGQGRPHRHGQRHPRLPARLAGRHRVRSRTPTPFEGKTMEFKVIKLDRKRNNVVRVAPRRGRGDRMGEEREQAARDAEGRRDRQGHRQEHHRLRRVRRPGRHRRPAAHHRPGLAPRAAPDRSGARSARKSPPRCSSSTPRRTASRSASSSSATIRGSASRAATRTARACSARSPTSPTTARSSRSSRASKAWCTSPRWTGPTRTSHPSKVVQLGDEVEVMVLEIDEDTRRISLGMKQCKANPWEEFAMNHKKGDKVKGPIKSITDFGVFVGLPRRHRRPGAPVRPVLERARRRRGAQLQEGRGGRGHRAGDRRRARAHLARHQAARRRSVHQLRRRPRQGQRGDGQGQDRSTRKGAEIELDADVDGYLRASEIAATASRTCATC